MQLTVHGEEAVAIEFASEELFKDPDLAAYRVKVEDLPTTIKLPPKGRLFGKHWPRRKRWLPKTARRLVRNFCRPWNSTLNSAQNLMKAREAGSTWRPSTTSRGWWPGRLT
jgi:hypothetical protein